MGRNLTLDSFLEDDVLKCTAAADTVALARNTALRYGVKVLMFGHKYQANECTALTKNLESAHSAVLEGQMFILVSLDVGLF